MEVTRVGEGGSAVNADEREFHTAMLDIYHSAKRETGYNATRFLQMVSNAGGLPTAKLLLASDTPSDGYTELWKRGRLDLTVEALIGDNPRWHSLFTRDEVKRARKRLADYGYRGRT